MIFTERFVHVTVILSLFFATCLLLGASSVQATEAIEGKDVYMQYCAICHGADAKGNGPMAAVLKPTATDLTIISKFNNGVFPFGEVYEIIDGRAPPLAHGTGQMPVWGIAFARDSDDHTAHARILELVLYLRSIQVK